MSRTKNDFNKPVLEQIAISRDRQTKITGNPYYVTPDPSMATMKTATDAVETAYNEALNNDKEKKSVLRIKRKELVVLMRLLCYYVQQTSEGGEEIILSSGFSVYKTPAPVALPVAPDGVKVKPATIAGELETFWKPMGTAKSYQVELSATEDFAVVVTGDVVTKAAFKATGLAAGTKYWVRVRAINAAGKGAWSYAAYGRTL